MYVLDRINSLSCDMEMNNMFYILGAYDGIHC